MQVETISITGAKGKITGIACRRNLKGEKGEGARCARDPPSHCKEISNQTPTEVSCARQARKRPREEKSTAGEAEKKSNIAS